MKSKLEYYREKKGLSREELAERVGIDAETIQNIEEGNGTLVKTGIFARIAEELEQEPSEIFRTPADVWRGLPENPEKESDLSSFYTAEDLKNLRFVCYTSAEELDALRSTLTEAREGLPSVCVESKLIQTVEVALGAIIRSLEAV